MCRRDRHEWARPHGETVRIGITAYAQEALGDIVYALLPAVGTDVTAGASIGELESTKTWSDVYAPVSGRIVAVNDALDAQPELLNSDPYLSLIHISEPTRLLSI